MALGVRTWRQSSGSLSWNSIGERRAQRVGFAHPGLATDDPRVVGWKMNEVLKYRWLRPYFTIHWSNRSWMSRNELVKIAWF